MNHNRGIIRIWMIVVPLVWIISCIYYFNNTYLPFYSCETPDSQKLMCKYSNGTKHVYGEPLSEEFCIEESWVLCNTFMGGKPSYEYYNFDSKASCNEFFNNADVNIVQYPKSEYADCLDRKKSYQMKFYLNLILIIIFPLTFYPIFLLSRRLYKWVKEGFNK